MKARIFIMITMFFLYFGILFLGDGITGYYLMGSKQPLCDGNSNCSLGYISYLSIVAGIALVMLAIIGLTNISKHRLFLGKKKKK